MGESGLFKIGCDLMAKAQIRINSSGNVWGKFFYCLVLIYFFKNLLFFKKGLGRKTPTTCRICIGWFPTGVETPELQGRGCLGSQMRAESISCSRKEPVLAHFLVFGLQCWTASSAMRKGKEDGARRLHLHS